VAKKLLTSKDVSAALEVEPRSPTPRVPGPMTTELQLTPGQWLEHYATAEEIAIFRAAVEARRARSSTADWRVLPDGSKIRAEEVLAGCPNCGRWMWVRKAEGFCPHCNLRNLAYLGHLRPATPVEVAEWFERETSALVRFKVDAPKRQADQKAFDLRRIQDGK
jgi:hypothetical protein